MDRLARLVDNLLDMSRLQAGALSVMSRPVAVDEVVPLALDDLGPAGRRVVVDVPDDLPEVFADPGLLERVIVNLVANPIRYSPPGSPPMLSGSALGGRVELRVVDRGTGIPVDDLEREFAPFQRLGDTDNTTGVGLGLALLRGLTEAMGGQLSTEETLGGDLTMVASLLVAPPAPGGRGCRRARTARAGGRRGGRARPARAAAGGMVAERVDGPAADLRDRPTEAETT